jgi:methylation protein EvaC
VCEEELISFVNLGYQPIANCFLSRDDFKNEYFFELKVAFCPKCKMVQLLEQPDKEKMFHENYAFFSSTSSYMQKHFKRFADSIAESQSLNKNSFVVEIGCNDGIMIQNFMQKGIKHLGVEPSRNVAKVAREKGINVTTDFFDEDLASKIVESIGKADVIVSANVICHIPYVHSIFNGVKMLLKDDGIFVFEDPYMVDIIEKISYDQIYDEHVFYFSVMSVSYLASMHNLEVADIDYQVTHGGSMRYTLAHRGSKIVSPKVMEQLEKEKNIGMDKLYAYEKFAQNIFASRDSLIDVLSMLKSQNKKIVGYGATSKSATVTNFSKITPELIDFISDTTPVKHNKFSPGVHIPILPHESFRECKPDYVLLFAWNHAEEIMEKEKDYMEDNGIKWIVYVPEVKVL